MRGKADHRGAIAARVGKRAGEAATRTFWKLAKAQLRLESAGKCGYCEASAETVAHCDVEHFRPQSVYWWLAYCYGNYVYACQICNQDWKGAQFPVAAARLAGPKVLSTSTDQELDALAGTLGPDPLDANAIRQFHAGAASEIPHLPDPYVVDPGALVWRGAPTTRCARWTSAPATIRSSPSAPMPRLSNVSGSIATSFCARATRSTPRPCCSSGRSSRGA